MITVRRGDETHLDGAAQVWAEATAARDGDAEVAPLDLARPIIAGVLGQPGSVLVVALDDDQVLAFAVAEPTADRTAEVRYVGVAPRAWGSGLGRGVLEQLAAELTAAGFSAAQLLVYTDNAQGIRLYERLGWRPDGTPTPHPRTAKPEQRYRLPLPHQDQQLSNQDQQPLNQDQL